MRNKTIWSLLIISVLTATILSTFASPHPDGLEKVAEDKGFIDRAITIFNAPIPDYLVPGIENESISTGLAGLAGVIITLGITWGIGKLVTGKKY